MNGNAFSLSCGIVSVRHEISASLKQKNSVIQTHTISAFKIRDISVFKILKISVIQSHGISAPPIVRRRRRPTWRNPTNCSRPPSLN
jgi:hypothetical protein